MKFINMSLEEAINVQSKELDKGAFFNIRKNKLNNYWLCPCSYLDLKRGKIIEDSPPNKSINPWFSEKR